MSRPLVSSGSNSSLKALAQNVTKATSSVRAIGGNVKRAGIVQGQTVNWRAALHAYMLKMVCGPPAGASTLKAMLSDEVTTTMLALVCSQSELIAKNTVLFERIDVLAKTFEDELREEEHDRALRRRRGLAPRASALIQQQDMSYLTAVVFIRPTQQNIARLATLLESKRYAHYHIFFSNALPAGYLQQLAGVDKHGKISSVQEIYADFYAVTNTVAHAGIEAMLSGSAQATQNNNMIQLQRDLQCITSLFLCLKQRPDIRYLAGSDRCRRLASSLANSMHDAELWPPFASAAGSEPPMLIIFDRNEDAVTPLLTPWTYQAMIHNLIGIKHNRLNLKKSDDLDEEKTNDNDAEVKAEEKKEGSDDLVLGESDAFFRSNMFTSFGELGNRVKKLVSDFQAANKAQGKLDTLDDMRKFIDNYPAFKMQSGTVTKHMAIMQRISTQIGKRKLMQVSALEQEIVCGTEQQDAFDQLKEIIEKREIHFLDKLRLVCLYAIRYNNVMNNLPALLQALKLQVHASVYQESVLTAVEAAASFAHKNVRTWPLFPDALSLKSVVKQISTNVKGIDNVYTQHKPMIHDILQKYINGDLKTMQFPFVENNAANSKIKYRKIIVYMVGGFTYEECACIDRLVTSSRYHGDYTVLLAGSRILSTQSFMAEIFPLEPHRQFGTVIVDMPSAEEDASQDYGTVQQQQPAPSRSPPLQSSASQSSRPQASYGTVPQAASNSARASPQQQYGAVAQPARSSAQPSPTSSASPSPPPSSSSGSAQSNYGLAQSNSAGRKQQQQMQFNSMTVPPQRTKPQPTSTKLNYQAVPTKSSSSLGLGD